jgi:hypothetical protein
VRYAAIIQRLDRLDGKLTKLFDTGSERIG